MLMIEVLFMALCRNDEFEWNSVGALMQKLEEGVLAIGAGLAPDNRTSWAGNGLPSTVTLLPFDSISSCWR
ncbi:hypothetical protein FQZ97_1247820 [compost metagenome]